MLQVTSVQAHGHRGALLSPACMRGLSVPLLGFPEGLADLYWDAVNFQRYQRYQISPRFVGGGRRQACNLLPGPW